MRKKLPAILIITAVLSVKFFISIRNGSVPESGKIILTENQIEPYLNIHGFDVKQTDVKNIRIPLKFSDSYQNFSDEMKNGGFELEKHAGEEVKCYTYEVKDNSENTAIQLLITSENELVSAALIEQKPNGFIKVIKPLS